MHRTPRLLIIVAIFAAVLTACGTDDAPDLTDEPDDDAADLADEPEDEGGDEPDDEGADEPDDAGATVATGSTDLGEVLVDGDGLTLYMFEPDEQGPPTCNDDCAESWPPLVTDGEPTADGGADADLLGTAERDDGSTQVTYDDWPLYRWSGDQAPGDVEGQGINDVWWVVGADGAPVREAAATDADEQGEPGY